MADTGDTEIRKLRDQFRRLASGPFATDLYKRIGQVALRELRRGFTDRRDPYGNPWKPSNGFGGSTLQSTRALYKSFSPQQRPGGFVIGSNLRYVGVHQYGKTIKAKPGKWLTFKVPSANRIATKTKKAGYKRKKFGRAGTRFNWVRVKQVTIPKRQMIPEGTLGPIWQSAFDREAEAMLREVVSQT